MATRRTPALIVGSDAAAPLSRVEWDITAATMPSVSNHPCYPLTDAGSDVGVYVRFRVSPDYVGTPEVALWGVLDGAPADGDDLGFGFRKRAIADNESADGTLDAEQTVQNTNIGSSGSNYSNEDLYITTVPLTGAHFAAGDVVLGWLYLDASGTTYAGTFLLLGVEFQYSDV